MFVEEDFDFGFIQEKNKQTFIVSFRFVSLRLFSFRFVSFRFANYSKPIFLRLRTDGWYVVTKGKICLFDFVFCCRADCLLFSVSFFLDIHAI